MNTSSAVRTLFFSAATFLALVLSISAQAKILGKIGPVYEVKEQDMIQAIKDRLQSMKESGELDRKLEEAKQQVVRKVEQPPGSALKKAIKPSTRYYDPSVIVTQDIYGANGEVIVKKGKHINPLEVTALTKALLFFDGNDEHQTSYAKQVLNAGKPVKLIMTTGRPLALMREWKKRVYFDQQGVLASKLGITEVPAVVRQEGNQLRIDTVALDEQGRPIK